MGGPGSLVKLSFYCTRTWNIFNSPFRHGATMWDFINIFTANANMQKSAGSKIEMQKNSGKLAEWIISHGRMFM